MSDLRRDEDRAESLRRAFDATFASPPLGPGEATEDFLALRIGGDPYAVRVVDVVRVVAAPVIVAVPSRRPAVLGVAAIRGVLVSVHSLAVLLGYAAGGAPRWLALAHDRGTVGLAFEDLESFVRAPRSTHASLTAGGATRPIVDVPAIVAAITTRQTGNTRSHA